jgi:octanoyl-[GcvH]:protein N-octanoyltransferase
MPERADFSAVRQLLARAGDPVLRVYRPAPTVAFGRLDAIRPGYERAIGAARAHGFEPVLRVAGGHAAAYHEGCVGFDLVAGDDDPIAGLQDRFARGAERLKDILRGFGIDARVGEIPGEYCPGRWSVNARGRVKLAGTAQRVVRHAWLLAVIVVVEDGQALRPVLEDVYRELDLELDPGTIGGAHDESPRATIEVVEAAIRHSYAEPL